MRKLYILTALSAACASIPVLAQTTERTEALQAMIEDMSESQGDNKGGPRLTNRALARPEQADYPPQSWLAGEEGAVRYEVAVDESGAVTSCTISESSGHEALDQATCDILIKRAEFEPALNEYGEAIAGTYRGRHRWRKREPQVPGAFQFEATFTLDETGRARDCEVSAIDGALPDELRRMAEKNACPFGERRATAPYRDENGVPVAKRVTVRFGATVDELTAKSED